MQRKIKKCWYLAQELPISLSLGMINIFHILSWKKTRKESDCQFFQENSYFARVQIIFFSPRNDVDATKYKI